MRLIYDDDLKEEIKASAPLIYKDVALLMERVPTIEPKRGKWEHGREIARTMLGNDVLSIDYEDWHCSCCGRRYKEYVLPYNFCPNCGAQMERIKE